MTRKLISTFIIAAVAVSAAISASAQEHKDDWKKKMMSEKVAFFTVELDLTPEEAQLFWPVYNKMEKARDEAHKNVIEAFVNLEKALESQKTGKEVESLLEAYLKALDNQKAVDLNATKAFKDVLPIEKVAKLYVKEEVFRRQYIRRLHGGSKNGSRQANR